MAAAVPGEEIEETAGGGANKIVCGRGEEIEAPLIDAVAARHHVFFNKALSTVW